MSVHVPQKASVTLSLLGEEGAIDLTDQVELLAVLGYQHPRPDSDSGTGFATLSADSGVRFFAGGRRISSLSGLGMVADGLVHVLSEFVRPLPEGAPVSPVEGLEPGRDHGE